MLWSSTDKASLVCASLVGLAQLQQINTRWMTVQFGNKCKWECGLFREIQHGSILNKAFLSATSYENNHPCYCQSCGTFMFIVSFITAKIQTAIYVMAQFNQQSTCSRCPHTTGRARILYTPWHDTRMLHQSFLAISHSQVPSGDTRQKVLSNDATAEEKNNGEEKEIAMAAWWALKFQLH